MSGGIAYVFDEDSSLYKKLNKELVSTEEVTDKYDVLELKEMIQQHVAYTNSIRVSRFLTISEIIFLSSRRLYLMTIRE